MARFKGGHGFMSISQIRTPRYSKMRNIFIRKEKSFFYLLFIYIFLAIYLILLPNAFGSATSESAHKPFLSSIPVLLLEPSRHFKPHGASLTLWPERSTQMGNPKKNRIEYSYLLQEDLKAPMVILIPGMGGNASSNSLLYLAEIVYRSGYSVVLIPSSTHWSFALAASASGRTGHIPEDARDMHRVIQFIKGALEEKYQIQPSQWGLLGISYGALDGAFLLNLNEGATQFNFLIMVNPPLNRSLAISKVDQYYAEGERWPKRKKDALEIHLVNRMLSVNTSINPIDTLQELERAFPLDEKELAWLLSRTFRISISHTAQIGNLLEQGEASSDFRGNMIDYLRESIYKKRFKASTEDEFIKLEGQSELMTAIANNKADTEGAKKIILFHSTNDYLSFPEGLKSLDQLPVEKHIYPYGGHLGLISDDKMIQDLEFVLSQIK